MEDRQSNGFQNRISISFCCFNRCCSWPWSCYNVLKPEVNIFKPIKKVRKERQSPAHKISDNHYDKKLNKKQIELLTEVCKSLKLLRMIFEQYPESKEIEVPKWLIEGNIKIF